MRKAIQMFAITFTDSELYELGDAVSPVLLQMLAKKDPKNNEAKYGSASNLVSIMRKIAEARSPNDIPDWLPNLESEVAALRTEKASDPEAAKAVAEFKSGEAKLAPMFETDDLADRDGIREFKEVGKEKMELDRE